MSAPVENMPPAELCRETWEKIAELMPFYAPDVRDALAEEMMAFAVANPLLVDVEVAVANPLAGDAK